MHRLASIAMTAGMLLLAATVWGSEKQDERLKQAQAVFQAIMDTPDRGIPQDLLARAACVGVIPSVKKLAIGIGGQHGSGYILCRKNGGKGPWGPPSGFSMTGGSFGLQLGVSATDFVLLFMNTEGIQKLLQDKFTLGADASVSAGPKGRTAEAATDAQMGAEILTYSRSKGLFAGVSLEGAPVSQDSNANKKIYGKSIEAKDLLLGAGAPVPAAGKPLIDLLTSKSPKNISAQ